MRRIDALDSMKALGLTLIVYGHVAHATTVALTPPVYVKQFGVAFFLFATAFGLAREQRPVMDALARRLRPVYAYGLTLAVLLSLVGTALGTGAAPSNYLPFAGGANVVRDAFPMNPTTWYIGTYLHVLLLWAVVLRRVVVRPWMIAVAVMGEVPIRVLLLHFAGPYVAYMLLTNWISVFLLGLYCGAQASERRGHAPLQAAGFAMLLAALLGGSAFMFWNVVDVIPTFPFMTVAYLTGYPAEIVVSVGASWLYLLVTGLVFAVARRVPAPALAFFVSRNSLVVFLAHMPVYYALTPVLTAVGLSYWPRASVQFVVCLFGLALVSEVIRAVLPAPATPRRVSLGFSS